MKQHTPKFQEKLLLNYFNDFHWANIAAAYCRGRGYRVKWCGPAAFYIDRAITEPTRNLIRNVSKSIYDRGEHLGYNQLRQDIAKATQ